MSTSTISQMIAERISLRIALRMLWPMARQSSVDSGGRKHGLARHEADMDVIERNAGTWRSV
ncbi:MAG TPA: hypothetical protein VMW91_10215, partial [Desulfosporosinus sp.]|nr:hypothetical protein [Desulfosporosinus sp.]